jgi:GAF domain-containing protein/anti-sigma regulatory factor (Ser/Thr protein kinase)
MKRLNEREPVPVSTQRTLQSVRVVLARMTDVLWEADPAGKVAAITPCRPTLPAGDGELDETEVARIEELWDKCVRCAERFSALYHVHAAGAPPRTLLVRAVPVLDERDAVLYWSGIAAETDGVGEADTRFIAEAASILSSSLNRGTIVNRFVQVAVDHFSELCAIHTFDEDGSTHVEGIGGGLALSPEALEPLVEEAARARQPILRISPSRDPARSLIVVPMLVGTSCIGTLSFLESTRFTSFGVRDVDVAGVVARQLAMAIENIKTFEREKHVTQRFRFLARVTDGLFATLDSSRMLQHLLDAIVEDFADCGVATTLAGERLRIIAAAATDGRLREDVEREIVASLKDRRSILTGAAPDVLRAGRLKAGPFADATPPRSWMMVPLFVGDAVYGAMLCCSNSRYFDSGELELLEEIGRRASLALEHGESFARERRLIQTLQQATLPTRLANVEGASLSAIYRPASSEVQVGGDWYDAFELDDYRVLLTVGDVTGHGLDASIVMGKLRQAINVVAMYERDPARILDAAERILHRRYPESVATAFAAVFDPRTRTIAYANAGHPYPIVRAGDGSLEELIADGLPIGIRSVGPPARSVTKRLGDAALLAFYTDGLTEATRDMLAGEQRLREALSTQAVFFVDSPAQFVEDFCLGGQSPDDVAVLLLNFVESERWKFDSGDSRAARRARRHFLASLAAAADPAGDFESAELVFGELVANVAQHATGPIDVALEWRDRRAVLHVIDRGAGYAAKGSRAAGVFAENGRGLWLIRRLGAKLGVENLAGFGTHVHAELPILRKD